MRVDFRLCTCGLTQEHSKTSPIKNAVLQQVRAKMRKGCKAFAFFCAKCYQLVCKCGINLNGRVHTIKSNIGYKEQVRCVKLNFRQSL